MKTITVTVIHPTDGRKIGADVDEDMVIDQFFDELIGNGFVPPEGKPYSGTLLANATRKEATKLASNKTFQANRVENNDTIQLETGTPGGK